MMSDVGLLHGYQTGSMLKVGRSIENDIGILILCDRNLYLRARMPDAFRARTLFIKVLQRNVVPCLPQGLCNEEAGCSLSCPALFRQKSDLQVRHSYSLNITHSYSTTNRSSSKF